MEQAVEGPLGELESPARLPTFLVIGAMKAGTTSLFHYLQAHPDVFMSPLKEVDFFIEEGNWPRGIDWYRRQFAKAGSSVRAIGEASTSYTRYPICTGVPARIATLLPDVRLIYVLRDPIERIRSQYAHRRATGSERAPMERAVVENPLYLSISKYAMQLEQYLERFPRERILLVLSEDLKEKRREALSRIYSFLGVDDTFVPSVIDREYYRTEERAAYPSAFWPVRRAIRRALPITKRAKEFVDSTLPRILGPLMPSAGKSPAGGSPLRIPDSLRRTLADMLREDVERLRGHMPDGFDGWGILDDTGLSPDPAPLSDAVR